MPKCYWVANVEVTDADVYNYASVAKGDREPRWALSCLAATDTQLRGRDRHATLWWSFHRSKWLQPATTPSSIRRPLASPRSRPCATWRSRGSADPDPATGPVKPLTFCSMRGRCRLVDQLAAVEVASRRNRPRSLAGVAVHNRGQLADDHHPAQRRRLALPHWGTLWHLSSACSVLHQLFLLLHRGPCPALGSARRGLCQCLADQPFYSAAVFRTPITPLGLRLQRWALLASCCCTGLKSRARRPSGEDSHSLFRLQPWACASSARSVSAQQHGFHRRTAPDLPVWGDRVGHALRRFTDAGAESDPGTGTRHRSQLAVHRRRAVAGCLRQRPRLQRLPHSLGRSGQSRLRHRAVPAHRAGDSTLVEGYQWSWSALIGLPLVLVGIVLINQTRRHGPATAAASGIIFTPITLNTPITPITPITPREQPEGQDT